MIKLIWVIFSIIFLILTIIQFYFSTKDLKLIKFVGDIKSINGLNFGISEFATDLNEHIRTTNKQNRLINITTGVGYLVAFFTSVFSYFLSN